MPLHIGKAKIEQTSCETGEGNGGQRLEKNFLILFETSVHVYGNLLIKSYIHTHCIAFMKSPTYSSQYEIQ